MAAVETAFAMRTLDEGMAVKQSITTLSGRRPSRGCHLRRSASVPPAANQEGSERLFRSGQPSSGGCRILRGGPSRSHDHFAVTTTAIPVGAQPTAITTSADGNFIYVSHALGIDAFSFESTGMLVQAVSRLADQNVAEF